MILFLHTLEPPSTVQVGGGFSIHFYGIAIALGILAALLITRSLAKRSGFLIDDLYRLGLWLVPVGLVGARLYHVANEWGYYRLHPGEIIAIWNGGLAIHGAIFAGLLTLLIWARRRGTSLWRLTDLFVPGVAIGQAIGRWGNYFNQELYGKSTTLPWGIPIDLRNRLLGFEAFSHFHPLFLYESILDFVLFIILLALARRTTPRVGLLTAVYLIGYSVIRFSLDFLRIDPVGFGWLSLAQIVSITLAATGVGLILRAPQGQSNP